MNFTDNTIHNVLQVVFLVLIVASLVVLLTGRGGAKVRRTALGVLLGVIVLVASVAVAMSAR